MTKVVFPHPPPKFDSAKWSNACWWRHSLTRMDEHGHLYYLNRDGNTNDWEDCSWVEARWNDDFDITLDGGFDKPTVGSMVWTYIDPIDYVDLLMVERPTPSRGWRQLTVHGEWKHPEVEDWPKNDE